MLERLVHGEVGVVELDVLADERDLDGVLPLADALRQVGPLGEIRVTLAVSRPRGARKGLPAEDKPDIEQPHPCQEKQQERLKEQQDDAKNPHQGWKL